MIKHAGSNGHCQCRKLPRIPSGEIFLDQRCVFLIQLTQQLLRHRPEMEVLRARRRRGLKATLSFQSLYALAKGTFHIIYWPPSLWCDWFQVCDSFLPALAGREIKSASMGVSSIAMLWSGDQ